MIFNMVSALTRCWLFLTLLHGELSVCFSFSETLTLTPSIIASSSQVNEGNDSTVLATVSMTIRVNVSSSFRINETSSLPSAKPTKTQYFTFVSPPATSSSPTQTPTRNVSSKGFCSNYTGDVCRTIISQTLTKFNESKRYFDREYGLNQTESFAKKLISFVNGHKSKGRCDWLLQVAICQAMFPACLPDGNYVHLCREDCESIWQECKDDLNMLTGSAKAITTLKNIDFSHLASPDNCSAFPSEHLKGNKSCYHMDLFVHSTGPSIATLNKTIVIYSAVGGVLLVFFIVLVTIICIKYRHGKEREEADKAMEIISLHDLESNTTMKERICSTSSEYTSLTSKIAELFDPNKLKQFSLDKIDYVCDLGEGQFGLVFKGLAKGLEESKGPSYPTPVAVKTLKQDSHEDSKDEFHKEVALMSILEHPHIVKLMAVATEEDPYCMIFEFMEYGDLNKFLREIKPLDDEEEETSDVQLCLNDFLSICRQVASGMLYLASLHFVHRDLATRNCLVAEELVVKIGDFGMSRDIYSSDYYKVHGDAMLPVRWMPPEALLHGKFTVLSDIYSYGVLMWEVFTYALQPYYGYSNEEVVAFSKQGVLLGQPDDCPNHIYDLMRECWSRKAEARPDFTTIAKRLVPNAVPSQYDTLKSINDKNNTIEIKRPTQSNQVQKNSAYQSPGTLINAGFIADTRKDSTNSTNEATVEEDSLKS